MTKKKTKNKPHKMSTLARQRGGNVVLMESGARLYPRLLEDLSPATRL